MSVRVTAKAAFSVSSTMADEKDLGNGEFSVRTDAMSEGGSWKTLVPTLSTDLEIKLDNIANVCFLFLLIAVKDSTDPSPSLEIKFDNIANTPITLKSPSDKKVGMLLITTDGLTALYVSNPSSYDIQLTVAVAGD